MSSLPRQLFGVHFQNPVLLAAGTCGFGVEVSEVVDLEALGGFVTKSVTLEARWGNPAPRVAEFPGGMLNSVGLANPGVEATRREKLPWVRERIKKARVFVSVAGHNVAEFEEIVRRLDDEEGFAGYEVNLSCPNDSRRSQVPFALDPEATAEVVGRVRAATPRPVLVKLAPNAPELPRIARAAASAGADGLTLVNTLPGYLEAPGGRRPALGAGSGGMSGPALLPAGLHAVRCVVGAVEIPVVGVGGIVSAEDAAQYLRAGARLVQMGTAGFADPRAPLRVIKGLRRMALPGPDREGAAMDVTTVTNQESSTDG